MKNLIFKGDLSAVDFEEKTMTFEIENDMVVQAGNYTIVPTIDYEKLVNGVEKSDSNCNSQNGIGSPTKILNGYVGMNRGEFDIENMTFHKNKKRAKDYWGKIQEINKVEVKLFL